MANGNDASRAVYQDAQAAALGERVTNLGRRQSDLEVEMRSGFRQIEQSFSTFTNETRASINALSSTLAERNKPQWQAIGVAITFVVVLGGLVYWPIRESTSDLKQAVQLVAERMVTRDELDWRTARGTEDRARTEAQITELRTASLPRVEWEEKNAARDTDIANLRDVVTTSTTNLQRQLDELKAAAGSVYSARDLLIDLRERLDRLERDRTAPNPHM